MTELVDLDASELRQQLGSRRISSVDLVHACIDRIEATNPTINAVVATCFDRALTEAAAADQLAATDQPLPPLHGLPVLIKDLADTEGVRTTYGSRCFADHVPTSDALVVERLRNDGAIVLGKTNTPEFGAGANTINEVYGATCNPYDNELTAGGSSGGSAAALAAGMAPLATGSDLGGSLRIPASFCGVVGMRPSPGLVPSSTDTDGFSALWTDGPMARSVADVALSLASMAGFDRRDPLSNRTGLDTASAGQQVDLSSLRIGVSTDLGVADIDHSIATVFENRLDALSPHLGHIAPLDLQLGTADRVFRVLRAEALHAAFAPLAETSSDLLGPNVLANLREGKGYSLADTAACRRDQTTLYRRFQSVFDTVDVLVCPATGVSPFPVRAGHPEHINGQPLDGYFAWYAVTWALSLTGSPVITVPCGLDHNGMPFGVQLVGPRQGDAELLAIAAAFERLVNALGIGRPPAQT